MSAVPLKICTCGKKGRVKRLVGRGAGIIFKGSGFYETDYRRRPTKAVSGQPDGQGAVPSGGSSAPPAKKDAVSPAAAGTPPKK
jgi:hypothetical protein